jgi:nucleoside-triphosphatase THEP1
VLVVLFGTPLSALSAALAAVVAAWILDPPAVRAGFRIGVVLGIVFAASITAAVVTWAEGPQRGILVGGMILVRLLVLTAAAAVLVRSVDAEALLRATERFGLERLGLVLGLALNSLPRIAGAASEVWTASKVRCDGTVERVRRLPGVGEVLLAHTARIAEEAAAAAALRGHSALMLPGSRLEAPVRVVVVTGPTGGGKTSAVLTVAESLRERGLQLAGFVQIGEFEDDRKTGFRLRDVATGEEADLAFLAERGEGEFGTRFRFSDEGFGLGREALARAAAGTVVIIDELGPVELRGQGHMPAVRDALATPGLRGAIIVVRRALVPSLLGELDASDAVVCDVAHTGGDFVESVVSGLGSPKS